MSSPASTAGVSVISTGVVSIRPEHVGPTRLSTYVWLMTSRQWTAPRPINVYVIERPDGLVLFDTGQDQSSVTDPHYFPGGINGLVYRRLARFKIGPSETLTAGLAAIGYDIADVRTAVISHLHQDHIGGLAELTKADIVVSAAEWRSLQAPLPELRGLLRSHIDLPGLRWRMVEPTPTHDPDLGPFNRSHDLFGDGSLVLLSTSGHPPGSLSMLVRRSGKVPLLMVGDLTYDTNLLTAGHLPGVGNKRQLRIATAMVNALREAQPGLVILPAHEPGAAERLKAAETVAHETR